MKIGILTMYYQNYNYGGQLQAYALCKTLSQQGHEALQISFDPYGGNHLDRWVGRIRRNCKDIWKPARISRALVKSREYQKNRRRYLDLLGDCNDMENKFKRFMIHIPHTEYVNTRTVSRLSGAFDAVVLGGDQIWNPVYYNPAYFGKWVETKAVTYAVSGGKDVYSDKEKRLILDNTEHLPRIGVREQNLYEILCEQYGMAKEIELVSDPVFLLSPGQWGDIAKDYPYSSPYLFAYLLNKDPASRNAIRAFAGKNGLPVLTIPHARGVYNECDDGFGDMQVLNAGPKEFIGLIKNASMVLTDSFHGTCFSLLFHKNFYSIRNTGGGATNERMRTVLAQAGAGDRLITAAEVGRLGEAQDIIYADVDLLLSRQIAKSKAWLQDALVR